MIPTTLFRQINRRMPMASFALVDDHTATAVGRAWRQWVQTDTRNADVRRAVQQTDRHGDEGKAGGIVEGNRMPAFSHHTPASASYLTKRR